MKGLQESTAMWDHYNQGDGVSRRSIWMLWQNYVIIGLLLMMYFGGSENARLNNERNSNADQVAVLRSQNGWLWHSHNVFKAVLEKDSERLHRGGAWEFAQKNWKQNELDFVTSYFDETAKADEKYIEREAHQQNKLLFMSSIFWDNLDELKSVELSNLPPNWISDYPQLLARLETINCTNVLEHLDSKQLGIDTVKMETDNHSLGSGQ